MLVGGVTMEKLMLHQTCKLAEFRNVAAQKINPMHHSKNTPYSPFLRQNRLENGARPTRVLIGPGHLTEAPAQQVLQFRAQIQTAFLCKLKRSHQLLWV